MGTVLALGQLAGAGLEQAVSRAVSRAPLPFPPLHRTLSVPCALGSTYTHWT